MVTCELTSLVFILKQWWLTNGVTAGLWVRSINIQGPPVAIDTWLADYSLTNVKQKSPNNCKAASPAFCLDIWLGVIFVFTCVEKSSREQNRCKNFISQNICYLSLQCPKQLQRSSGLLRLKIRGGGDKEWIWSKKKGYTDTIVCVCVCMCMYVHTDIKLQKK